MSYWTLLLLNLNIQLKNKEVWKDRKLHLERTSTMEKMSVHFMKGREKLFRIESLVDKVEKNLYNKKITLEEIEKIKRDFHKIKFDHTILEEYSNF